MLNSLRYRLLAWLLLFVLLTAVLIIPANVFYSKQERNVNQVILAVNNLYTQFLKDSKTLNDFLTRPPADAFEANATPEGNNEKLISQLNMIRSHRSIHRFNIHQDLNLLTGQLLQHGRISDSIMMRTNLGISKSMFREELYDLSNRIEVTLEGMITKTDAAGAHIISRIAISYGLMLLLIIGLITYFSFFISRHVVSHLEKLAHYLSGVTKNRFSNIPPIRLHNPPREISQLYSEFRHLLTQLEIRERQRDKALEASEESLTRYRELTEMLPQSIFETNSWGNYTYANQAWFKNFGFVQQDLDEGLNLIETLISESQDQDILGISRMENLAFMAIRKDGSRFPASVYTDNIIMNGEFVGRRGIIIDITDKIKYIQSLQKETHKAKNADELKSSFLANMSHEIRTPVNSIIGFSNLLAMEQIPDGQKKEFVQYIRSSSETLLNLIDDIIDIAKIEAGELKIKKRTVDISRLFDELLHAFSEAKKKYNKDHLDLTFDPGQHQSAMMLKTDPFRLKQILSNLLANAIKFTHEGSIEFGYKLQDEKTVEFFVRDTGPGLTRNELDRIFERFKRSRLHEKQNIAGTGLGLAISKNLVQLLGGEMWVNSVPEEGTVFYFTLPYITDTYDVQSFDHIAPQEEEYNFSGKKILIAEDDNHNFNFLRELMRKTRAEIVRADTGAEAVEICRITHDLDLVLMDIQLPEMNGIEATKRIKSMHRDLPVIAQTAFAMAGDREKIQQAGCDAYMAKPLDIRKLLATLHHYLKLSDTTSPGNIRHSSPEMAAESKIKSRSTDN